MSTSLFATERGPCFWLFADAHRMEWLACELVDHGMAKAMWNDTVIAESDETVVVEGNHYFPPDTVSGEYLVDSTAHTVCPWKGVASYYDVAVNGEVNRGAAWYYPDPSAAASQIAGYIAFWRGVRVEA